MKEFAMKFFTMCALLAFTAATNMQSMEKEKPKSAKKPFLEKIRFYLFTPKSDDVWYVAREPVRNFAQQVAGDQSIDVAVTSGHNDVAFEVCQSNGKHLIVYHKDVADVVTRQQNSEILNATEFDSMIKKEKLDSHEMMDTLRQTMTKEEVEGITLHEYGHALKNHTEQRKLLLQKRKNNEISEVELFDAYRKMEFEADAHVVKNGSQKTIRATQNYLNKVCVMEKHTHPLHFEHPSACTRALKMAVHNASPSRSNDDI
jgi:hypothetical protein